MVRITQNHRLATSHNLKATYTDLCIMALIASLPMSPLAPYQLALVALCVSVLSIFAISQANRSRLPLPPGPKGRPLVGLLYDIPHKLAFLKFEEWAKWVLVLIHRQNWLTF